VVEELMQVAEEGFLAGAERCPVFKHYSKEKQKYILDERYAAAKLGIEDGHLTCWKHPQPTLTQYPESHLPMRFWGECEKAFEEEREAILAKHGYQELADWRSKQFEYNALVIVDPEREEQQKQADRELRRREKEYFEQTEKYRDWYEEEMARQSRIDYEEHELVIEDRRRRYAI
jgi:hypothetical protein